MSFNSHLSTYEQAVELFGEEIAKVRWEKACGCFLIVEAREEGTRLFIRCTNPITDVRNQHGWWDTFTITKTSQKPGLYIAKVNKVRYDQYGYPIFVVEIVKTLDKEFQTNKAFTNIIGLSNMFVNEIGITGYGYNYDELLKLAETFGDSYGINLCGAHSIAKQLMCAFLDDKVTITQIEEAAHTMSSDESKARNLQLFFQDYANQQLFPLTFKKIKAEDAGFDWNTDRSSFGWEDLWWKFEHLMEKADNAVRKGLLTNKETFTSQYAYLEAYFRFDEERKERNKAIKTAAKKAKKAKNTSVL